VRITTVRVAVAVAALWIVPGCGGSLGPATHPARMLYQRVSRFRPLIPDISGEGSQVIEFGTSAIDLRCRGWQQEPHLTSSLGVPPKAAIRLCGASFA